MTTEEAQDPGIAQAEKLVTALRDDLPQLFELSYTPRWDLYDSKVYVKPGLFAAQQNNMHTAA
jgi:hypothetical protein